ncbi:MAG: SNF2-related protein [Acidimicrobiia bacterium]
MSPRALPDLQLSWTGADVVAWSWDGGEPSAFAPPSASLYGAMLREWGWLPPGSWSTTIDVAAPGGAAPGGVRTVAAIALPALAVVGSAGEPRRSQQLTASSRWVRSMVGLARHVTGHGHLRPLVALGGGATGHTSVRWQPLDTPELQAALDAHAALCPPAARAATVRGQRPPPADADEFTAAFHRWLVDLTARVTLRSFRWAPDLTGQRSAEATAARAVGQALSRPGGELPLITADRTRAALGEIAAACDRLHARATGAPLVTARLRLALPDDLADAEAPWPIGLELADRDDPSRWCAATDVWAASPLALELAGEPRHVRVLETALRDAVGRLAREPGVAGLFASLVDDDQPAGLETDVAGAAILLESLETLDALAIPLLAPGQLVPSTARVRGAARPAAETDGRLGRQALVQWTLTLGGDEVDAAVIERAIATGASLINVDGRWIRLDQSAARRAVSSLRRHQTEHQLVDPATLLRLAAEAAEAAASAASGASRASRASRAAGASGASDGGGRAGDGPVSSADLDIVGDGWLDDLLAGLPDDRLAEGVEPPGFSGSLRHYQRRGLGWLQFLERLGLGGCLADDMGLGKTPTTLAHLVGRPGPHLVLCPLSVVRNWQAEAARFAPGMRCLVHHGNDRRRGDVLIAAVAGADLVVTTYGLAVRDVAELSSVSWQTVVLDEAQAIKNPHTHAARAVRKLPAAQKIALTGTPVENRLSELWAILDVVNPGLLGSEHRFRKQWAQPIERDADVEVAARLRRLTSPFVLRRTKADRSLVPDLPDKVEQIAWATLTREQAAMYQAVVDRLLADAEAEVGMKRRGLVLAALTRLKQICNHPAHAASDGSRLAGRSGKLARFDELVVDLLDADERALVFTQYREMGELLQRHLAEQLDLRVPFLHGGVSKSRRDRMVDHFQDGSGPPLLIVSLKAGGTGLNLTAATRVVHYDRWWNPAVEDQATDRAWRIGQHRSVFVHKLVCQGTVEERISELIDDKRRLAGMVIGGTGEAWLSELSTNQLRELVVLGGEAVEPR